MKPIQFNMQKSKDFYDDLKKQVKAYFDEHQKSDKGNWVLYSKTIILLSVWIALYLCILFVAKSTLAVVWFYVAFGLVGALIGFNVMHDGAHGSYSQKKWLNTTMWYTMNILGSEVFLWQVQHNILHHTYTNIEWWDDDIDSRPVFRFHPEQKHKWFHRYQHIYFLFFYGLSTIAKMFFQDFKRYFTTKVGQFAYKPLSLTKHIIFWCTKVCMFALYILVPMYFIWVWNALLWVFIMYFFMWIFLAVIFQLAHVLDHTTMVSHTDNKVDENWAVHELATTANFSMRSKFWTWLLGGLNFQVEHHLFPQISHVHYPQLAKIVQRVCHQYGIPYHSYATIGSAFVSHVRYIKKMGRA